MLIRAAALEGVLQADLQLAPPAVGQGIERLHTLHLEHGADLQMILQVAAHARQVHHRVVRHTLAMFSIYTLACLNGVQSYLMN